MIFVMLEINLKLKLKVRNQIFIVKHYLVKNLVKFGKLFIKILNPNDKRIRINPNELNKYFSTTSKRLTGRNKADFHALKYIINNMSLSSVNYIPISFVCRITTHIYNHIASPLTYIITSHHDSQI